MLQDVQDLRDHMWVPREWQDQQLKTIDQVYIYYIGEEGVVIGGMGVVTQVMYPT